MIFWGLTLLTAATSFSYLSPYFRGGLPMGFDGSGHYFLSLVYSKQAWPSIFSWLDQYFQGMPFPRFYPPLLYLILGAIYRLFSWVDPSLLFKITLTASAVFIPGLVALILRALGVRRNGVIAGGFFAIPMIAGFGPASDFGIGLMGALEKGLASQNLGLTFFLLLLLCLLREKRSPQFKNKIFLCLTTWMFLWSNYHTVIGGGLFLSLLLIFWYLSGDKDKSDVKKLTGLMAVGFLAASPWYLQAWIHRHESPGLALNDFRYFSSLRIFIAAMPWLLISFFQTQRNSWCRPIILGVIGSALVLSIPIQLSGVPWQPWRILSVPLLLLSFGVGLGVDALPSNLDRWAKIVTAGIFLLSLERIYLSPYLRAGVASHKISQDISELRTWMEKNPATGYTMVGAPVYTPGLSSPEFYLLSAAAGSVDGNKTLWSIFRESSLNSLFAIPLRNIMSIGEETFGIRTFLTKQNIAHIPWEARLQIARHFGISRFIYLRSDSDLVEKLQLPLQKKFQNDFVTVYDNQNSAITDIKTDKFFAIVAPIQKGDRQQTDPGINRLFEELIFVGAFETPILAATSCENWKTFKWPNDFSPQIICMGTSEPCCQHTLTQIQDFSILQAAINSHPIVIHNRTTKNADGVFAVPLRQWELAQP